MIIRHKPIASTEGMESPHVRMSQDEVFRRQAKLAKDALIDLLAQPSDKKYRFTECCLVDGQPKVRAKLLDGKICTLTEAYSILMVKYDRPLTLKIEDNYIGCIIQISRNNWHSYKLADYVQVSP